MGNHRPALTSHSLQSLPQSHPSITISNHPSTLISITPNYDYTPTKPQDSMSNMEYIIPQPKSLESFPNSEHHILCQTVHSSSFRLIKLDRHQSLLHFSITDNSLEHQVHPPTPIRPDYHKHTTYNSHLTESASHHHTTPCLRRRHTVSASTPNTTSMDPSSDHQLLCLARVHPFSIILSVNLFHLRLFLHL